MRFRIIANCLQTQARYAVIETAHGPIETPAFLPVATSATVKGITPHQLRTLGAQCLLANTYHLGLRPGAETVHELGGIHKFMGWDGPVLTDSGGFQVYSLGPLVSVSEEGATFRSHLDGRTVLLTPEESVRIQELLGADITVALDVCLPAGASRDEARLAMDRTHRWARRSWEARQRADQAMFGIVQGGHYPDLREESAAVICQIPFDGYAVGGLSVGEPWQTTWKVLRRTVPCLPQDRPRYLMGVGSPEDMLRAIAFGIDLFDCVLPTRVGRTGTLFAPGGRISLVRSRFREMDQAPVPDCECYTCRRYSGAYLRHLFLSGEISAARLATMHNLHFLLKLMDTARRAIREGWFHHLYRTYRPAWRTAGPTLKQ